MQVTRNSVFDDPKSHVKASLRSALMLPSLAIIDPLLTLSVPRAVTCMTGLDALTQNIEPYVSNSSNPITDAITVEGIRRAARSLPVLVCGTGSGNAIPIPLGGDKEQLQMGCAESIIHAREDMCIASVFGGIALANAKLGAVHGFAGPLGGMLQAPHGGMLCPKKAPVNKYDDGWCSSRHGIKIVVIAWT